MGNSDTKQQKLNLDHPKLKNAHISAARKIVIDYRIPPNYLMWSKKHNVIRQLQRNNCLFLPQIQQIQSQNFCGSQKSLKLIFDYFPYTLDQQILRRQKMNQKFSQQQLWYLLYQLLSASSIFQKKRQKSGDIRPRNILINDQGIANLISVLSFPDQITNYYKSLLFQESTYLAPQELGQLQAKMKYCRSDPVIAESFSIGLTIMDAALLFNSQQLYDMKSIAFKNYLYTQNLVAFKSMNLSPFLTKTVLNLMQAKSFDRPTPGQSLAILLPYQKQILQLQEFVPDRQKSKQSLQQFQHFNK